MSFLGDIARVGAAAFTPPEQQQGLQDMWRKQDQTKAAKQGPDAAMEWLQSNDPETYTKIQAYKAQIEESSANTAKANAQTEGEYLKNKMEVQSYVGNVAQTVANLPNEQRTEAWKQIVPHVKQVDPNAPDEWDEGYAAAAVSQAIPAKDRMQTEADLQKSIISSRAAQMSGYQKEMQYADELEKQGRYDEADAAREHAQAQGISKGTTVNLNTQEGTDQYLNKGLIDQDIKQVNSYAEAGTLASKQLSEIQNARTLLSQTPTGFGQESILKAKQALQALGYQGNVDDISNQEAFKIKTTEAMLAYIQQTKGSISESENKMYREASPNLGNSPQGNAKALDLAEVKATRTILQSSFYRDYLKTNRTLEGADSAWQAYVDTNHALNPDLSVNKNNLTRASYQQFLKPGAESQGINSGSQFQNPIKSSIFNEEESAALKSMSDEAIQSSIESQRKAGVPEDKLKQLQEEIQRIRVPENHSEPAVGLSDNALSSNEDTQYPKAKIISEAENPTSSMVAGNNIQATAEATKSAMDQVASNTQTAKDILSGKSLASALTNSMQRASQGEVSGPTQRVIKATAENKNPIEIAEKFLGKNEIKDKSALTGFFKKSLGKSIDPATTPWCAEFANAVLASSGGKGTGSLSARSFLNYGKPTSNPTKGDIVVLSRGKDPSKGHVGFYAGKEEKDGKTYIKILGGNQGDSVSIKSFPEDRLLGYRTTPTSNQIQQTALNSQTSSESNKTLESDIKQLAPKAKPDLLAAITDHADVLEEHGINTPARKQEFFAQLAHESAGFTAKEELPSKYASSRSPYKGRGLIQLTGKSNYKHYGDKIGVDLVKNPELAADPENALKIAATFWEENKLNKLADAGNTRAISKKINGGTIGLKERLKLAKKAKSLNLFSGGGYQGA